MFTKKDCEIDSMKYLPPLGLSKHCTLSFEFMSESRAELHFDNFKRRNFFKTDLDKLFKFISEADLMTRLQNISSNEKGKTFCEVHDKAIELCVLLHKPRSSSNKKPKWLNSPIERKIRCKEEAWNRYRARKTPSRRSRYLRARNDATNSIRRTKYEYEKRVALDTKISSKHFWRHVRDRTKVKEELTRVKTLTGDSTRNDSETAEEMNRAFSGVYVREAQTDELPTPNREYNGDVKSNIVLNRKKLMKMKKLKTGKACGPDGISRIRRNLFIHKARIPARRFSSSISQHFKMFPPFASNEGYTASGLCYQSDGA